MEKTLLENRTNQTQPGHRWLVIIIVLAIILRMAAAFYLGDQVVELPGTSDQVSYDALAQRLLAGHGFSFAADWWPATPAGEPTAHWSYLYTLYLAAVYGLIGYHPLIARLIQAILAGWLMPWLVYRLGRRHFGPQVGLIAAGLMAVYAYFIYYAAALMTETFYITGILWVLDLASKLGQTSTIPNPKSTIQNLKPKIGLGLALAVTVLLRQVFLLFIPVLFGWLLWRSYCASSYVRPERNRKTEGGISLLSKPVIRMIGTLLVTTVILLLAIAPWTARNYRVFDRFVLLNTNAGFAFFWANHPIHGYYFIDILPASGPSYQSLIPPELLTLNEAALDQALLKRGLGFVQEEPIRYLSLSFSRVKDYFKFWPSPESSLISNVSRVFSFGLLWPLMLYGLILNGRRALTSEALILYLFAFFYITIHLLSWALIRYRLPVDAILIVFAGAALVDIWARLAQKSPVRNPFFPRRQTARPKSKIQNLKSKI